MKEQAIEGLVEFYEHWNTLRCEAIDLSKNSTLSEEQAVMIEWMVHVIDCVGPADLVEKSEDENDIFH